MGKRTQARLGADGFDDQGMVTAEAAMVLPSLVVILALAVTVLITVGAKLKVIDAAREAARISSRGDADGDARAAALRLGPTGSKVTISHRGRWVDVDVQADVHPFGLLPGFTVKAHTYVEGEQP